MASGTLSASSSYSKGSPSPGLEPGNRMIRPTEVFPDLHHKMSKKIAQLTKVIYHLNSKNEDHQVRRTSIMYAWVLATVIDFSVCIIYTCRPQLSLCELMRIALH